MGLVDKAVLPSQQWGHADAHWLTQHPSEIPHHITHM